MFHGGLSPRSMEVQPKIKESRDFRDSNHSLPKLIFSVKNRLFPIAEKPGDSEKILPDSRRRSFSTRKSLPSEDSVILGARHGSFLLEKINPSPAEQFYNPR
jgi:hypothetical protein